MTVVPHTTVEEALEAYEMAEFELDRAALVHGITDLDYWLAVQETERLRRTYLAVESQQPDRTPFAETRR